MKKETFYRGIKYIVVFALAYALGFLTLDIIQLASSSNEPKVEIKEPEVIQEEEEIKEPAYVYLGEEGAHIWKAKHGILDQYADIWWRGPFWVLEDEIQVKEGNFLFGKTYMPQSWWLNMSEDERELRVRLLQEEYFDLAVKDFRPAEYEVYYEHFVKDNNKYEVRWDELEGNNELE